MTTRPQACRDRALRAGGFRARLWRLLDARGLDQKALGRIAGISETRLSRVVLHTQELRVHHVAAMAGALGVSAAELAVGTPCEGHPLLVNAARSDPRDLEIALLRDEVRALREKNRKLRAEMRGRMP